MSTLFASRVLLLCTWCSTFTSAYQITQHMKCGEWPLCGVLVIESAPGRGVNGDNIEMHGLWPETHPYGNSECWDSHNVHQTRVAPWDGCDPKWTGCNKLQSSGMSCNDIQGKLLKEWDPTTINRNILNDTTNPCWFAVHEWIKHGACAGFSSASNYTKEVASVATPVLQVAHAYYDTSWENFKTIMSKYFNVWSFDEINKRVMIATCSAGSGVWHLSCNTQLYPVWT